MSGRGTPQQGTGTTYRATVRMATALSGIAVLAALVLRSLTDVSQTTLVLAVIFVAFVASLAVTEREARTASRLGRGAERTRDVHHRRHGHRVTVLPAAHRVA